MTGINDRMDGAEARAYLDSLTATVPDRPAPLTELLAGGERARRRQRRRTVVAAAVVVAIVVGGGSVATSTLRDDTGPVAPAAPVAEAVDITPGTRLVGADGVVLAIPEHWAVLPAKCRTDGEGLIATPGDDCVGSPARALYGQLPVPSVVIGKLDTGAGAAIRRAVTRPDFLSTTRTSTGAVIEVGASVCSVSTGEEGSSSQTCSAGVLLPDLQVAVNVNAPSAAAVDAIVDSIRVLPAGRAVVPNLPADTSAAAADDLMSAMGLDPFLDTSAPATSTVVSTDPVAGTVVGTGDLVIVTTRSTTPVIPPSPLPQPVDGSYDVRAGTATDGPAGRLTFEDGEVFGGSCVAVRGTYASSGRDGLTIDVTVVARGDCVSVVPGLEERIGAVRRARTVPDGIRLYDDEGAVLLTLSRP